MMNDDLRRTLEEAGRDPAPDPGPGFALELEQRLSVIARTSSFGPPADPAPADPGRSVAGRPGVPPRRTRYLRVGAVAAVVGTLAVLVIALGSSLTPIRELELTDAVNVEVALADGTTFADPDGLLLPEGAVVRVGTGGSARVGDVLLGAGDVATVDDRQLRIDRMAELTPSVGAVPTRGLTPEPVVESARPTTPRASGRPATAPPVRTAPPDPTARPRPATPTPPAAADPRPTATPRAGIRTLRLVARPIAESRVAVSWTGTPRAERYILIATRSRDGVARDPTYPGSPVVGEFTHPPAQPLRFRVAREVTEIRLVVIALGADRSVVGRSAIVIVTLRD